MARILGIAGGGNWVMIGTAKAADVGDIIPPPDPIAPKIIPSVEYRAEGFVRADWMAPELWFTLRKWMCPGQKFTGLRTSWFYKYGLKKRKRK